MRILFSITIILLSSNIFASEPVLTKPVLTKFESKEIVSYLDGICGDTYCGGDINYYPQDIKCDETSCTLTMRAVEYYSNDFDIARLNTEIGNSSNIDNYKVTLEGSAQVTSWDLNSEADTKMNAIDFSCKIKGLKRTNQSLSDKIDSFYDHTVCSCVPMMEGLL